MNRTKEILKSAGLDPQWYKDQAMSFYEKVCSIIDEDGCRDGAYLLEKADKAMSILKDLKDEEDRQERLKTMKGGGECSNPECGAQGMFEEEVGFNCPVCEDKLNIQRFFTDGSGWNGQKSATCVYDVNNEEYCYVEHSENWTNNDTEWKAVIDAIIRTENESIIHTDSRLVEQQFNGGYAVNEERLKKLYELAKERAEGKKIIVRWIPREKNLAGKYIEKKQGK